MTLAEQKTLFVCSRSLKCPPLFGLAATVLTFYMGASNAAYAQTCPDLSSYYLPENSGSVQQWAAMLPELEGLMPSCLQSSEYFALLGAAQLNTSQVSDAMESLERAMLLDPENGAAQIDYAEGLFLTGQLLPALEVNGRLRQRQDLPGNIAAMLEARQQAWQQLTSQRQFLLEVSGGYDNNLNGAPTRNDLTLTIEGTPIALTLDPEFQPRDGIFSNVRLGGYWQSLKPSHTHDLLVTARARLSSEQDTDLGQLDWRYTFSKSHRRHRWELGGGTSHLMFGGNPLYTVTELRARYSWLKQGCQPIADTSIQHLLYHGQTIMNGIEGGFVAGLNCVSGDGRQQFRAEGGYLNNQPLHGGRPGGARDGWQWRLNWQALYGPNEFALQFNQTDLDDQRSYSPILANGAIRKMQTRYLGIRYKRNLPAGFSLLLNVGHQEQKSNLEPFNNRGTVGEAGLGFVF